MFPVSNAPTALIAKPAVAIAATVVANAKPIGAVTGEHKTKAAFDLE